MPWMLDNSALELDRCKDGQFTFYLCHSTYSPATRKKKWLKPQMCGGEWVLKFQRSCRLMLNPVMLNPVLLSIGRCQRVCWLERNGVPLTFKVARTVASQLINLLTHSLKPGDLGSSRVNCTRRGLHQQVKGPHSEGDPNYCSDEWGWVVGDNGLSTWFRNVINFSGL